jgi:hypothetical protein
LKKGKFFQLDLATIWGSKKATFGVFSKKSCENKKAHPYLRVPTTDKFSIKPKGDTPMPKYKKRTGEERTSRNHLLFQY